MLIINNFNFQLVDIDESHRVPKSFCKRITVDFQFRDLQ